MSESRNKQFAHLIHMPPAMVPYVNLFVNEQELDLVLGLADQTLTQNQVADMMNIGLAEAQHLLKKLIQWEIITYSNSGDETTYAVGRFYFTFDYWTAFETGSWGRVPKWRRNAATEWVMQEFIKLHTPSFEKIEKDPDTWVRMKNRDVLLLDEALDLMDASEVICVLPCACKALLRPASPIIEGSMRVGARAKETLEIGQGRGLTPEEAKRHLLIMDRMGLVHTGPKFWREHDPSLEWVSHGNCNIAYSFPFRAGFRLGLHKKYPRVHYVAQFDSERCISCGTCIGRCPFGALYHDGATIVLHGETRRKITFDADQCYGCGLCATSCPQSAVTMQPL